MCFINHAGSKSMDNLLLAGCEIKALRWILTFSPDGAWHGFFQSTVALLRIMIKSCKTFNFVNSLEIYCIH